MRLSPGELDGQITWRGEVHLRGDVILAQDATLHITPGTRVRFLPPEPGEDLFTDHPYFPGSELIVYGRVVAEGTADNPIYFQSFSSNAPPGSWGGINFQEDSDGIFSHCVFSQADSALHSQNASLRVTDSYFTDNLVAVRFNTTRILIRNNLLANNGTGIRFHFGAPTIENNILYSNDKGFFITSFPRDYRISGNSIIESRRYSVALGEEVPEDVRMMHNFWGETDVDLIARGMFDGRRIDYLGRVLIAPVLEQENSTVGPAWKR